MFNFILAEEAFSFVLTNYPKLVALVALAEAQFPAGSSGAAKLQYVHDKLMGVQTFASNAAGIWPVVSEVVAGLVALLPKNNATAAVTQVIAAVDTVVPVAPAPTI